MAELRIEQDELRDLVFINGIRYTRAFFEDLATGLKVGDSFRVEAREADGVLWLRHATPGAQWREAGEPDPHGKRYDCERAELALGHMSDDELANGAFMNYNEPLDLERALRRDPSYHSPIAWMTAVKDRIRWLSRKLEEKK